MESNRSPFPVLWSITPPELPNYPVKETKEFDYDEYDLLNIFGENFQSTQGIEYDISRVSSRNARKSELGPYKNSFLRDIITTHSMGKTTGTKADLVATILKFHEEKSK